MGEEGAAVEKKEPEETMKKTPPAGKVKDGEKDIFDLPEKTAAPVKNKPEEPAGQASSGTKDITAAWNEVLAEIKKTKPTLEAALREGSPLKTEENTVFISFRKTYGFHKSIVEKPANIKIIEKVLSRITGIKDIKIEFVTEDSEKSMADSSEVKKILKFFNGEIVKLEE
jgi:hypothetical protein